MNKKKNEITSREVHFLHGSLPNLGSEYLLAVGVYLHQIWWVRSLWLSCVVLSCKYNSCHKFWWTFWNIDPTSIDIPFLILFQIWVEHIFLQCIGHLHPIWWVYWLASATHVSSVGVLLTQLVCLPKYVSPQIVQNGLLFLLSVHPPPVSIASGGQRVGIYSVADGCTVAA